MATNSPESSKMRRRPRQARSQQRVNKILDVAENMFIEKGYDGATTNAIATQAEVPIGSLYQFFPDKAAIVQALAERYMALLHQKFMTLHTPEAAELPLADYVNQMIDAIDQFFLNHPGYHAIFIQVQNEIPELEAIEAATDAQLIQELAAFLALRGEKSEQVNYDLIAFVLVKSIGSLLWVALSQEPSFRQQLVTETKRYTLSYLQSYFSSDTPTYSETDAL